MMKKLVVGPDGPQEVEMSPEEEVEWKAQSDANDPAQNPPNLAAIDQAALNVALDAEGSITRALGLVMFAEINKLRVKGGDPAYTLTQFKAALKAQMR